MGKDGITGVTLGEQLPLPSCWYRNRCHRPQIPWANKQGWRRAGELRYDYAGVRGKGSMGPGRWVALSIPPPWGCVPGCYVLTYPGDGSLPAIASPGHSDPGQPMRGTAVAVL